MSILGEKYFVSDQPKIITLLKLDTMVIGNKMIGFKQVESFEEDILEDLHKSSNHVQ
ncbi:TPA: hypothetical protein ACGOR8_001961 [Streptococcus suis]